LFKKMSFSKIVGQERVIEVLRQILKNKRLPQVLLFYGPSGVGKRTVALELAKVLNCQTRITVPSPFPLPRGERIKVRVGIDTDVIDACDNCLSCQKIDKGIHPDVRIVLPEKDTLGIEQIRELNRVTQWKPFEGKWKVYILEKAEKLTQEAANSFLKTLEEPPPNVLLILLSENKDVLLPTIVSRSWSIPFSSLSEKAIEEILKQKGKKCFSGLSRNFAGRLQEAIFGEENIIEVYKPVEEFWANLSNYTYLQILKLSEDYAQTKEGIDKFLTLLLLSARAKGYWQAVEFVQQAKNYLQRNLNRHLVLDCLFLKLRSPHR